VGLLQNMELCLHALLLKAKLSRHFADLRIDVLRAMVYIV
jgi:hypothetical protein